MAKIVRYNGNLVPFASASLGTERTIFGEVTQANDITSQFTADFLRGWGIVGPSDQPTLQDFNAVSYTHGQILAYLHQMGVAEYNAAQEYHIGSQTVSAGVCYTSLANSNTGNTPASSPASWRSNDSGKLISVTAFIANTTYTAPAGTNSVIVEMVGGGGAGGGAPATAAAAFSIGGGGGAGGYTKSRITSGFAGAAIVVGAGGAGVAGLTGGNGGSSAFGSVNAGGGNGGAPQGNGANAVVASGGGGSALGATGNIANAGGAVGGYGLFVPNGGNFPIGGVGAPSFFGGSGFGATTGVGGVGLAPGAGGGGSSNNVSGAARVGGAGAPGIVIVYAFQ